MDWFLTLIKEGGVQGAFLIVWISVFAVAAVANLLGRRIPHATYLVLVLIRDIRMDELKKDTSDLAVPMLVYRLRAMRKGDTGESKIVKAMELAREKGMGMLGQEAISRAVGDFVSVSFEQNRSQADRFAFVGRLFETVGLQAIKAPSAARPTSNKPVAKKPAAKKRANRPRRSSDETRQ